MAENWRRAFHCKSLHHQSARNISPHRLEDCRGSFFMKRRSKRRSREGIVAAEAPALAISLQSTLCSFQALISKGLTVEQEASNHQACCTEQRSRIVLSRVLNVAFCRRHTQRRKQTDISQGSKAFLWQIRC